MKLKNLSKIMPLCVLACLTSCNAAMTTAELEFIDEKVEVTLSEEKFGYVKKVKRILNELEPYADPSYVARLFDKYRDNSSESSRKMFAFTDDFPVFEMLENTIVDSEHNYSYSGFISYDNGYKAKLKKVINEGRSPYGYDDEYYEIEELRQDLTNANFRYAEARNNPDQWYTQVSYTSYSGDLTFDFRPVIEGYALEKISRYLTDYGRCKAFSVKTSPNNMYVLSGPDGATKDYTFDGPYGKPITIKNINEAYISMASAVNNKTIIDGVTYSPKFIDLEGARIENDAAIVIAVNPVGNYGIHGGIETPQYAFKRMKRSDTNFSYDEGYGVCTILFRNEEIVYCSKQLDVKYGGVSYGKQYV